jgi:hypothetical protein
MMAAVHLYYTQFAMDYGLVEAIILTFMCYGIEKNMKNNRHFHDGRYWIYNSVQAFYEIYPYVTKGKIRGALNKLVKKGVLFVGNFNKQKYDRTKWYSISDDIMNIFFGQQKRGNNRSVLLKKGNENRNIPNPICSDEQIDSLPVTKPSAETDKPIPLINNINHFAAASQNIPQNKQSSKISFDEIKHELKNVDAELSAFKKDFFEKISEYLLINNLDISYLKFVYGECLKKKPDNIRAYYRKLVFEPDQIDLFKVKKDAYEKEHPKIKCPACGEIHDKDVEECPSCNFKKGLYDDEKEVKRQIRMNKLSQEGKANYERELSEILSNVAKKDSLNGETIRSKIHELDKKYNLLPT